MNRVRVLPLLALLAISLACPAMAKNAVQDRYRISEPLHGDEALPPDLSDYRGVSLSTASADTSGVYFYKLTAKNYSQTRRMVVLK